MFATRRSYGIAVTLAGLAIASVPLGTSAAVAAGAPSSGCADVEIIVSRGTSEPGTVGSLSVVSDAITKGTSKTVRTFGNPYPASFNFTASAAQGVTALVSEVTKQSAACTQTKYVLIGYSQGAMVTFDSLAGSGFGGGSKLSKALSDKVIAAGVWGNPEFNSKESFDAGTFKAGVNGTIARGTGALKAFESRIIDECLAADGVCQGNGALNINAGHLSYPRNQAAIKALTDFAVKKINGASTARTAKATTTKSAKAKSKSPAKEETLKSAGTFPTFTGTFPTFTPPPAPASAPVAVQPKPAHKHWWQRLFG